VSVFDETATAPGDQAALPLLRAFAPRWTQP
jgi:hypothetical protein